EPKLEMRVEAFEKFPGDEETLVVPDMKIIGRERKLNGTITTLVDIDNSYGIIAQLWAFKNSEWVKTPMIQKGAACEISNTFFTNFLPSVIEEGLFNDPPCPFDKGEYPVVNLVFNVGSLPSYLYKGLLKLFITYTKDGKSVGGFVITFVLKEMST
ncbi:hypothetical protein KR018_001932, partial [Drosophila ironensis]